MKEMPVPILAPYLFQQRLLAWFADHGRHELPWQQARTPYRVWVSEIMLQQTQVTTVIPYFERFMARFPDVQALAEASQDEVLHLWTGLGYYARGRNLHKAARVVMDEHGGAFPVHSLEAMAALPGIGRSTAGAVIAQSTGERAVILDGNVKRVLTRLHAVAGWPGRPAVERRLWALAEHYTPHAQVVDFTQAMMDLGATLCRRGSPDCGRCPFRDVCVAHARGEEKRFPESKPKKALPTRETLMLLLQDDKGRVLLEQRPPSGLWGGLWSLPQFDDHGDLEGWLDVHAPGAELAPARSPFTHVFSHFRLEITPQPARVTRLDAVSEQRRWVEPGRPDGIGLAAPVKGLLESLAPFTLSAPQGPRPDSQEEESPMSQTVFCRKYQQELEALPFPPLPGKKGQEIQASVSRQAWEEWQALQTRLINEKHLNMLDPASREYLMEQMERFLDNRETDQAEGYVPRGE